MKTIHKVVFIVVLIMVGYACQKDFIVKNIKNDSITINAPADNLTTISNAITFWWEALDGAEKYNVQVVKPNFSAVQELVVDTNVTGTKFKHTFLPGTYQWRIRAINAGGNTQYQVYNLVIDTTSNLTSLLVGGTVPLSNYVIGSKTLNFSWNSIASATTYSLEIVDAVTSAVITTTTTSNPNFSYTFASAGFYNWKVKAFNSFSISQYNTAQTFSIDLTAPNPSLPLAPTNSMIVSNANDSLKWKRNVSAALLDAQSDVIYLSQDTGFSQLPVYTFTIWANSTSGNTKVIKLNSLGLPAPTGTTTPFSYYWKLRSIDSVKNVSGYSSRYSFRLNP